MTLPSITFPVGMPPFLADGHGIEEDSVYAQVQLATGHSRARRVSTVIERVATVGLVLHADDLAVIDDWYENTLLAGTRQFSAQIRNQGAGGAIRLWWAARWISFETEMLGLIRVDGQLIQAGRVSGQLLLTGDGSAVGPDTGAIGMEIDVALLDVRSMVSVPKHLAMEVLIELLQPQVLRMEVLIELLNAEGVSVTVALTGSAATASAGTLTPSIAISDPDFASVTLLLHFNGANNSSSIVDSSSLANSTAGSTGGALIKTAQSVFGGSSLNLAGGPDYIFFNNFSGIDVATGDFTGEVWFRVTSIGAAQVLMANMTGTGFYAFLLYVSAAGKLVLSCSSTGAVELTITGTTTVSANTWYHAAFVRDGSTFRLWLDGASEGTASFAGSLKTGDPLYIGTLGNGSTSPFGGYLDDLRFTKGVARYVAPFTRPAAEFPDA